MQKGGGTMIVRTTVQFKKDPEPRQYYALVFEDVSVPMDFITYRNALTMVIKEVLSTPELDHIHDECFWLLQLSEFISTSLDEELETLSNHEKKS